MADTKNNNNKGKEKTYVRGRGTVKAVLSGDTVVIVSLDKSKAGPPVERTFSLSNLSAPYLARSKPEKKGAESYDDEPYAWASREYLRKKVIGKQVSFITENKAGNKDYGTLLIQKNNGEEENVNQSIVSSGWAKVRKPNSTDGYYRPEVQELIDLEEAAQSAHKGIWNRDPVEIAHSYRPYTEGNAAALYEKNKGKPLSGIVEYVRAGNQLKVFLLPSFTEISFIVSGVQTPSLGENNGELEPFAREAKFYTEFLVLNRDVNLVLEGMDKFNFNGSISVNGRNLGEELLSQGLGKYADWSGCRTAAPEKLKNAEKVAREKGLRVWGEQTVPLKADKKKGAAVAAPAKGGKDLNAKVVEVINGGTIKVVDAARNEHRVFLSSIKVSKAVQPFLKKDDEKKDDKKNEQVNPVERAYAIEAKEYLRKRLIGQRVRCVLDYNRVIPLSGAGKKEEDRAFHSVYLDKNNVAVELVEAGLAETQEHRAGEPRSKDYEFMMLAEERAKAARKGIHGPKEKAPVFYVNDVSQMEVSKARNFLPFLKKVGKQKAVVESVFSASRYKLYVPKESVYIVFTVAAIATPTKQEEFNKESTEFAREFLHQRDVEIEVMGQDRGGAFLGNIWVNKKNVATILLEEGFAQLISVKENDNATEYIIAEQSAKRSKKHIWKTYDEAAEKAKRQKAKDEAEEQRKPKQELHDLLVTEIIDANRFYVQLLGPQSDQLEELMKNISTNIPEEEFTPAVGSLVKAQFSADDQWYRAKVLAKSKGGYEVSYIDYGNTEEVPASKIKDLEAEFRDLPPQAQLAQLALVKAPGLAEDYGHDAAVFVRDMVMGKTLLGNIEFKDAERLYVTLGDRESQVTVNNALVRAGLARVESRRDRNLASLVESLRDAEDYARRNHSYIWEYGDPGFDDEEDVPKGKQSKPQPKKDAPTKSSGKEEKH